MCQQVIPVGIFPIFLQHNLLDNKPHHQDDGKFFPIMKPTELKLYILLRFLWFGVTLKLKFYQKVGLMPTL